MLALQINNSNSNRVKKKTLEKSLNKEFLNAFNQIIENCMHACNGIGNDFVWLQLHKKSKTLSFSFTHAVRIEIEMGKGRKGREKKIEENFLK